MDIARYHETIGQELRTLFNEYSRLYDITDMYYHLAQHNNPDYVTVTLGLDPSVTGHKAKRIEIQAAINKNRLEYPEQAREHIPHLHQLFIKKLYKAVRQTLIHRDI